MIDLWTMEKENRRRFVKYSLVYLAILFSLPLLTISYVYAAKISGIAADAEPYRTKGYDAQQRGDIDTAIEWYQKAANVRPEYAAPHNDLGILFETKGWLDRAEAEYEKALAIDPGYKEVHTNLALLYERKGELEKAAFHWMRRYKLGTPDDPWTQEAKNRLEKLGLIDKIETPAPTKPIEKKQEPKPQAKEVKKNKEPKQKKESEWSRLGSEKKDEPVKSSKPKKTIDKELEESLRLAEERLKKERRTNAEPTAPAVSPASSSNVSYNKAKDYYAKGEYAKALDTIRIAKQNSGENKSLLDLEEEVKFKMKEERMEDHYKEGMIHYRQKDFAGARKEFEAILNILPE
ncbi:MAG: tetratricopeptide repeat protein [Candidatus Omnitrophota bacterium]|nr:tetratricopeptide repeat protein [Candidatus Omnitrophota bacterium]